MKLVELSDWRWGIQRIPGHLKQWMVHTREVYGWASRNHGNARPGYRKCLAPRRALERKAEVETARADKRKFNLKRK